MVSTEEIDIVIVGGGICGLATALALHRKGIKSVVLERSDTLQATGAAIGVYANGWRALHQLGLASTLRSTAIPFQWALDVWVDKDIVRETRISGGEVRCLRRIDLVEALANELPAGMIRFGCQVLSVDVQRSCSTPVLQLHNGSIMKAKVLIGCDGANSVIANFVGLKPTQPFSNSALRGLTIYPNGHGFTPELLRIRKDKYLLGRIPIDDKTVYWFVVIQGNHRVVEISKDPASIRQLAIDSTAGFSTGIVEMIKNSDLRSLSLTRLRFRAPWKLLMGNFRREAVTVAGDAWHVMGPFLGQGGSAALEDAIVLARCLSKRTYNDDSSENQMLLSKHNAREALDEYLKERRPRVLSLSTQTYLRGILLIGHSSLLLRCICFIVVAVLFSDPLYHTRYDCGEL